MQPATVRINTVRVYLYITLLTLVITVLGHLVSTTLNLGLTGTGVFLVIAGIIDFLAYFFSDRLILRASRAKPLKRGMAPEFYQLVENLCRKSNLPLPKLYIIQEEAMNAFATGRNIKHAAVAVTRGLLEKLQPAEIEGVVAHELTHIKNLDMRLAAVVSILVGLSSILADLYWTTLARSRANQADRSGILSLIGMVLSLFTPITGMLIQLAISRQREFMADGGSTTINGQPNGLISALQKIGRDRIPLPNVSFATAHLYFSQTHKDEGFIDKLMSTHPPLSERIARLQSFIKP